MKLSHRLTAVLSAIILLLSCCSCSDGLQAADYQINSEQFSFTNYASSASDYQLALSETDSGYLQDYEKKQENSFLVLYYRTICVGAYDPSDERISEFISAQYSFY